MADQPGTLEQLVSAMAGVFQPIGDAVEGGTVLELLAELGIQFPDSLSSDPAFSGALNTLGSSVETLPGLVESLISDVEAGNFAATVPVDFQVIKTIRDLIVSMGTLANAIDAQKATFTGLTPAEVDAFTAGLVKQLLNYLIISQVEDALPVAAASMDFIGVFDRTAENVGSTDPLRPPYTKRDLHLSGISSFLQSPSAVLQSRYGWGAAGFDGRALFQKLETLGLELGFPAVFTDGAVPTLDFLFLQAQPKTDVSPPGLNFTLASPLQGSNTYTTSGTEWSLTFSNAVQVPVQAVLSLAPDGSFSITSPSTAIQGNVQATFKTIPDPGSNAFILVGDANGSRLEFQQFSITLDASLTWNTSTNKASGDYSLDASVQSGLLVIDLSDADGFIGDIVGAGKFSAPFDIDLGVSQNGFYFHGSGGLQIQLPLHLDLGPIQVQSLTIGIGLTSAGIPVSLGGDLEATLGPLVVTVQDLGVTATFAFADANDGNLGPLDVSLAFKPPLGAGLSIDTGIVTGGGFLYFDPASGEYAGVAELSIADIVTVKAIGLITTKMPDGTEGFSLLVIISAEFTPIQLGFGFTLVAVGGLLGLNRAVLLDVLRDGVRTGAVNSIMFPTNIIANAPRIISDLRAVFPPQQGVFLVGPMAKFGWGTPSLITLSLGVIVEIPPGNIAILGILKIALPSDDAALIQIQVNFVGTLDFDKQMLAFDAGLYDSYILFLTLEGDMAVRLQWGDNGAFLLSVGGFHPAFHPPPLDLPALKRVKVTILDYPFAQIWVQCYFAVTSNTVQFGAQAHLQYGTDDFNVHGDIGFDALFQFSPFYFNATISGSLGIDVFGAGLMSIDLRLMLEGISPWHAKGTGSISLLFFSIDVNMDITWGRQTNTSLPPVDVIPVFIGEVNKQQNWKALPPPSTNLLVSLRAIDPSLLVLHPFGALTVSQRAIPLNLTLDKFGNQTPDDTNRIDISAAANGGTNYPLTEVDELFASAQFQKMSDADKLSRPSYQQFKGGVTIGSAGGPQSSKMTRRTISYAVTIIDKEPVRPPLKYRAIAGLFQNCLAGSSVARSTLSFQFKSQFTPYPDKIATAPAGYTVASTDTNKAFDANSSFPSEAMAVDALNSRLAANPSLTGTIHVLPTHEVNHA